MIPRQIVALSTAAALGLVAVTGCSSSAKTGTAAATGSATPAASTASAATASNAGLAEAALLTAFKAAVAQGTAVHVKGSVNSSGDHVTLDLQLNKQGASASGTIGASGTTIPIIAVGGVDYFQFTPGVLKLSGADSQPAVAALLKDKWVSSKSTIGSSMATGFSGFASYDAFLTGITSSGSGGLSGTTSMGTTTYAGQTVAAYKASDGTARAAGGR